MTASAQPIKILLQETAPHFGDVGVDQAFGDRAGRAAVADLGAVEAAQAGDAETRGCEEHLFGVRRVEEIDVPFHYWNGELTREIEVGWSTFRPPQTAAYAAFCVLLLLWRLHKRVLQISPADPSFRDA